MFTIQHLRASLAVKLGKLPKGHAGLCKPEFIVEVIKSMTREEFNRIMTEHKLTKPDLAESLWRGICRPRPSRRGGGGNAAAPAGLTTVDVGAEAEAGSVGAEGGIVVLEAPIIGVEEDLTDAAVLAVIVAGAPELLAVGGMGQIANIGGETVCNEMAVDMPAADVVENPQDRVRGKRTRRPSRLHGVES